MTAHTAPLDRETDSLKGIELTPGGAAMTSLVVVAFPMVWLLIQAFESWSGTAPGMLGPDPVEAGVLLTIAAALLAVPGLIALAVEKSSRALMTTALVWTSIVALSYCWSVGLL